MNSADRETIERWIKSQPTPDLERVLQSRGASELTELRRLVRAELAQRSGVMRGTARERTE